jgi:hypothetical protein
LPRLRSSDYQTLRLGPAARQIRSLLEGPSLLSSDESSLDSIKKLVAVYNRILSDEVHEHALYAKVLLATGFGLIAVGVAVAQYYLPLGLLLILVGVLRTINSIYDFQREESLKKKMRLIRQEFGDILLQL